MSKEDAFLRGDIEIMMKRLKRTIDECIKQIKFGENAINDFIDSYNYLIPFMEEWQKGNIVRSNLTIVCAFCKNEFKNVIAVPNRKEKIQMTKYGYARSATEKGNIEKQKQRLQKAMCNEIHSEIVSGVKKKPVLEELLGKLKKGDTLVVTGFNVLSRKISERMEIEDLLIEKEVDVEVLKYE